MQVSHHLPTQPWTQQPMATQTVILMATPTALPLPLHAGEQQAGTIHPAASGLQATGLGGPDGLDVTIKVEISPSDREGKTQGYGFSIPGLSAQSTKGQAAAAV